MKEIKYEDLYKGQRLWHKVRQGIFGIVVYFSDNLKPKVRCRFYNSITGSFYLEEFYIEEFEIMKAIKPKNEFKNEY
jgi:hypothetical protein